MRRAAFLMGIVAIGIVACQTSQKAEVASLIAAVERFQRGANADRPALAAEVARVPCTEIAPACAACTKATSAMGRAVTLKTDVEAALDRLEAGTLARADAERLHLDATLAEAMRLLDEARAAMPDCEARLNALRR